MKWKGMEEKRTEWNGREWKRGDGMRGRRDGKRGRRYGMESFRCALKRE